MDMIKGCSDERRSEREELKAEIQLTLAKIAAIEAQDIEAQDIGQLGWLENHLDVLRAKLAGRWVDREVAHYEYVEIRN